MTCRLSIGKYALLTEHVKIRIDSDLNQSVESWLIMATFREALSEAIRSSFCTLTGPVERTIALGENLYERANFPGFPPAPTPAGQALRGARNILCNMPPDDASSGFVQPFTGGQCPGTRYAVTADVVRMGVPNNNPSTRQGDGPIQYFFGKTETGACFARIESADNPTLFTAGSSFDDCDTRYNIISVVPVNGPDDCGDPPVNPEPYDRTDFETDVPVTYDDDNGNPVTVNVPLLFTPVVVDNDIDIEVPVRAYFDTDLEINATLNLSTGDVNFNVSTSINAPTIIEDVTIQPDPVGVPGDPPTDEEEFESTIIGVYVRLASLEEGSPVTEIASNNPGTSLYVPRLGSVSFHCEVLSASGLGWTEDIDIKYASQLIPCPVSWGARSVVITPTLGAIIETTLIRATDRRQLWIRGAQAE